MTTAYTSLLGLALPVTGELSGTWGDVMNGSITSLVDAAIAGTTTLNADVDVTLSSTSGITNQSRQAVLLCTGARTALRTITAPAKSKTYVVINATSGGFSVKLAGPGPTTGITVANGATVHVVWNGSDFVEIGTSGATNFAITGNLSVGGTSSLGTVNTGTWNGTAVAVAYGGTGATDAGTARTNLGLTIGSNVQAYNANLAAIAGLSTTADNFIVGNGSTWTLETPAQARSSLGGTTVGQNLFTLSNPGSITFLRLNADNTVSALNSSDFRTAIGAGTGNGNGTVTSVSGTGTVSGLTLSGTVTSSGSLTLGGTLTLTSGQVTTALGFTPYSSANPSGFITGASPAITTPSITGTREISAAIPSSDINLSTGNYFSKTISSGITFTVSNVPTTGTAVSFILDLTNGGAASITWFSGTDWPGGVAPTLTASGRDVLGFFTYDGGTNWTGIVLGKDVK